MFMRSIVLLIAVAASASADRQTPLAQPPAAERGAALLSVSFAAVAADGSATADLKQGEITIKIDGRDRPVRSLQLVSVADAAARGEPAAETISLPPPFGTNSTSDTGRTMMLAIDDESFKPGSEHALRQAIDRLIAGLSRRDRVSLVTIPYGGVTIAATTEHSRIRTALSMMAGRAASGTTGSDLACRSRLTLEALAKHVKTLGVREAPSVVMLVSAGLAAPRRDNVTTMAPGMCELTLDPFREVAAAAGAARTQFYIVQPADIMVQGTISRENIAGTGFRGSDNPVEGMEQLIGVTGGKLLNIGGGTDTAFDRIVRESAAYYVATIDAQGSDRGRRSHQLDIRVARPGVQVRAPRAISFAAADAPGAKPAKPSPRDMLSTLDIFRDLPLRATAYSSFEPGGSQVRVITLAEPVDPAAKIATLMAALFDREGKSVSSWVAQPADLERTPIIGAMTAPPGAYRLRVAAIDATGRTGTADYDVLAEVAQTGPLKLSSIILGLSRSGTFQPKMQFTTEPVAIGYVEMTGAPAGGRVNATLEISQTANGPAIVTVPLAIESGGADRYVARGAVPIGALAPGDYVVRAMVGLEGHPPTRVIRTLRKAIPAK
jgi:VWFA-related protein